MQKTAEEKIDLMHKKNLKNYAKLGQVQINA